MELKGSKEEANDGKRRDDKPSWYAASHHLNFYNKSVTVVETNRRHCQT
jgi:hypothetical protein